MPMSCTSWPKPEYVSNGERNFAPPDSGRSLLVWLVDRSRSAPQGGGTVMKSTGVCVAEVVPGRRWRATGRRQALDAVPFGAIRSHAAVNSTGTSGRILLARLVASLPPAMALVTAPDGVRFWNCCVPG